MATKTISTAITVCDLDHGGGGNADVEAVKHRVIVVDGSQTELDVCERHDVALNKALMPFVAAGDLTSVSLNGSGPKKKATAKRTSKKAASRPNRRPREETDAIRTWARHQGHDVSERGRISNEIVEAFQKSHKRTTSKKATAAAK